MRRAASAWAIAAVPRFLSAVRLYHSSSIRARRYRGRNALSNTAQIEPLDDIVRLQLVDRIRRHRDLSVDDDVAAIGDTDGLVEILLSHQDGETKALLELADFRNGL